MRTFLTLLLFFSLPVAADQDLSEDAPRPRPQLSIPSAQPVPTPVPAAYGILTISRERQLLPTPCAIGVYIDGRLSGRIYQSESLSINLPPGIIQLRLKALGDHPPCQGNMFNPRQQSVQIVPAISLFYQLAMDDQGLVLLPGQNPFDF